jgi:hypothetical protein
VSSRRRGPALVYIDSAGHPHDPARQALTDPVERALCRALLDLASQHADKADTDRQPQPHTGHYL